MATAPEPECESEPVIVRKGWCEKHGKKGLRHVWKRRLLILLSNHELAYFESEDHDNQREVDLAGASDIELVADHDDHQFCFDICFGDNRLQFAVNSHQERNEWIFNVRNAIHSLREELAEREATERAEEAMRRAVSAEPPLLPKRRQSWWNRAKDTDASGIEHASIARRRSLKEVFGRRTSPKKPVSLPLEDATPSFDDESNTLEDSEETAENPYDEQQLGNSKSKRRFSDMFRTWTPEPKKEARREETIVEAKAREAYEEPIIVSASLPPRKSVTFNDFIVQAEDVGSLLNGASQPRRLSDYFRTGGFGDAIDEIKISPNQLQTLVEEFDDERSKLAEETTEMHENFEQAEAKRRKSEQIVSTLEHSLQSQKSEVQKLRDQFAAKDRLIAQLRSDNSKHEVHVHELEIRMQEFEDAASTYRLDRDNAIKHELETKQENDRLEEKLRAQAEVLASEKHSHSSAVQHEHAQVNRLESEMKLLRQVSHEAQSHEAQFTHLQMENENLRLQLRNLQSDSDAQLESKRLRVNQLNETIRDLNERLLLVEHSSSSDASSSSELMRQLHVMSAQNRQLRSQEDQYLTDIQGLERQVNHAKGDAQRYQNELIHVQSRLIVIEESIKAREIAWQRIERETRAENEDLKTQCERYEREMSQLKKSVHSATRKYKHLRHQSSVDNISLRTELHVAQQERRRHQRMESVEMDSINKLTIEAEHLRSEKRRLEQKMKELQGELVAKQDVWHRVWRQLSDENELLKKMYHHTSEDREVVVATPVQHPPGRHHVPSARRMDHF